jgi:hypothetical protein
MKKIIAYVTLVCVFLTLFSVLATTSAGLIDSRNSTVIKPTLPPQIGGSNNITSTTNVNNETTVSNRDIGEGSINLPLSPVLTPNIEKAANGSWVRSPTREGQNWWWSIDYWTNTAGTQLPSKMTGKFILPENNITGLEEGDVIKYLPLNVAYGTSSSDFVWYQFCVYFKPEGVITMYVWEFENGETENSEKYYVHLPYVPGHKYEFDMTPSGTDTLTFTITDTATGRNWYNSEWKYTVPGLDIIWDQGAFSPASAIEGETTNDVLYDVPYFQTYVGDNIATHYHGNAGSGMPDGIDSAVWLGGSNHYLWAMFTTDWYSVSSISLYDTYGPGSAISHPEWLRGTVPDYKYAAIYGANPGDGGVIVGEMNALAGGEIYIWGYSKAGYSSDLYVYVANEFPSDNLRQVGSVLRITTSVPHWIYVGVGTIRSCFKYIAVVGYDTGLSVSLRLDSVHVDPV